MNRIAQNQIFTNILNKSSIFIKTNSNHQWGCVLTKLVYKDQFKKCNKFDKKLVFSLTGMQKMSIMVL